jgi:hypothetical protein
MSIKLAMTRPASLFNADAVGGERAILRDASAQKCLYASGPL